MQLYYVNLIYIHKRCDCGNCQIMSSMEECICCQEIPAVRENAEMSGVNCITDSQIFKDNCLNRNVLQVSMYEYIENVGPIDDNQAAHE